MMIIARNAPSVIVGRDPAIQEAAAGITLDHREREALGLRPPGDDKKGAMEFGAISES